MGGETGQASKPQYPYLLSVVVLCIVSMLFELIFNAAGRTDQYNKTLSPRNDKPRESVVFFLDIKYNDYAFGGQR